MGFLKPTQPRRGCAAFGPGAIPRRALPTPPAPWRRPLAALVLAGSIGTMGMAAQNAAAAEVNPSTGHHDTASNSGKQSSHSSRSAGQDQQTSRSKQTTSPKRAAKSSDDCNEQSTPRRARSESSGQESSSSSGGNKNVNHYSNSKKSSGSTGTKSNNTGSRSSGETSSSTNKKRSSTPKSSSSSGTSSKKYTGSSKSSGSTGNKKRTSSYKNSTSSSGGSRSGSSSSTGSGSSTSSSSSSASSASSATNSDTAASSSTTTVNGAAAPLAKGSYRIGAAFGATGSWSRYHTGQDFAASSGTPVYAVTSGTVISGNVGSWAGNYVAIRSADGSSTLYAHMSSTDVKVGQQVTAGQKIGNVGSTGRSFGAHLHFEYYPSGVTPGDVYSATNPMSYLRSIGVSM